MAVVAISVPNREIEALQRAVEDGQLMMIVSAVDIARERLKTIVSRYYLHVVYVGEEGESRTLA